MSVRNLAPVAIDHHSRDITAAPLTSFEWWREDPAGVFSPVASRGQATHVLDSNGVDTNTMVPIEVATAPLRMNRSGDTHLIYGF